jgi:hypothetical protein
MADDRHQSRASNCHGVFSTPNHLTADDVAGYPDTEDVTEPKIKNRLRRGSRVDATEDDRQWMLAGGGCLPLSGGAAFQWLTSAEPQVSLQQSLQGLLGAGEPLHILAGMFNKPDFVVQARKAVAEAHEAELDPTGWRTRSLKICEQVENVGVDEIGVGCVDQ